MNHEAKASRKPDKGASTTRRSMARGGRGAEKVGGTSSAGRRARSTPKSPSAKTPVCLSSVQNAIPTIKRPLILGNMWKLDPTSSDKPWRRSGNRLDGDGPCRMKNSCNPVLPGMGEPLGMVGMVCRRRSTRTKNGTVFLRVSPQGPRVWSDAEMRRAREKLIAPHIRRGRPAGRKSAGATETPKRRRLRSCLNGLARPSS